MAEALLNMPTPWGGSGGAAGRGLPRALTAVREALLGMQRAGLPPQLLFSDRDFTAGDQRGRRWEHNDHCNPQTGLAFVVCL
jgi:hypothetical protein